jgi:hypothetical protein
LHSGAVQLKSLEANKTAMSASWQKFFNIPNIFKYTITSTYTLKIWKKTFFSSFLSTRERKLAELAPVLNLKKNICLA